MSLLSIYDMLELRWLCFVLAIILPSCVSPKFVAVPANIDRTTLSSMIVPISASRYSFAPEIVRVTAGTLVQFKIVSTGGTHGFSLSDFGVDVRLEENDVQIVEVYFPKAGEYGFRCSHICGLGHLGMTGKIIVE